MATSQYPRLTGGVFLTLIAREKVAYSGKNAYNGDKDKMKLPSVMAGLINVAKPEFEPLRGRSFETEAGKYRKCELSDFASIRLSDTAVKVPFDEIVRNNYSDALRRMCTFADRFIDSSDKFKIERLVRSIIEIIQQDDSIDDCERFYIGINGSYYEKHQIICMEKFHLESFLLGIWHFIIMQRPDNIQDLQVFDGWLERRGEARSRLEFVSNIGEDYSDHIEVTRVLQTNISECGIPNASEPEQSRDAEYVVSPELQSEDRSTDSSTTNQVMNNPVFFNFSFTQNGGNGQQYGYVESIVINHGKDK